MAYREESFDERLERIKKQNAEIRLRHMEVEADKKMAKLSRASVHNHVTTSFKDMMPAERDAILNKNEQIENSHHGNMENPKRSINSHISFVNKSRNSGDRKQVLPFVSVSQKLENKYGYRPQVLPHDTKVKVPPNSNIHNKYESDDDDDDGDLFKNVQDLKSDDLIVSEQVQLSGNEMNPRNSSYMGSAYLTKQDFVPDSQMRLDAAVPAPSESSPFLQFLSNMDFTVPPPPFVKGASLTAEPQINVSVPPPKYNKNIGNSDFTTPIYTSEEYNDIPNIYVPYAPSVGPHMMNPHLTGNHLPSEAAPYPRSVLSHRSSPPCGLLPPSTPICTHDNISAEYSNFQPTFSDPTDVTAYEEPGYSNELPSIQLLEKALHAMGGNGQVVDSHSSQRNVNTTPHNAEESVLNISGIEITKEAASDLLKKALAIVSKEKINNDKELNSDNNSDLNGMKVLQLLLESERKPNAPCNGRPILGRGARDQNVGGIEQTNYHPHSFSDKNSESEARHYPGGYQGVVDDQISNNNKQTSYEQENYKYRPILGRTESEFERNRPDPKPSISQTYQPPPQHVEHKSQTNNSTSVKKSNVLARMEAARNDTSHRFSRSIAMSQQKVGTVQLSYQGKVIQTIDDNTSTQPKSDSHLFPCSDVREKDKLIALEAKARNKLHEEENLEVVKALVAKKTQLEEDLKSTKESNIKIEEKLKSLSLQKMSQVNEIP